MKQGKLSKILFWALTIFAILYFSFRLVETVQNNLSIISFGFISAEIVGSIVLLLKISPRSKKADKESSNISRRTLTPCDVIVDCRNSDVEQRERTLLSLDYAKNVGRVFLLEDSVDYKKALAECSDEFLYILSGDIIFPDSLGIARRKIIDKNTLFVEMMLGHVNQEEIDYESHDETSSYSFEASTFQNDKATPWSGAPAIFNKALLDFEPDAQKSIHQTLIALSNGYGSSITSQVCAKSILDEHELSKKDQEIKNAKKKQRAFLASFKLVFSKKAKTHAKLSGLYNISLVLDPLRRLTVFACVVAFLGFAYSPVSLTVFNFWLMLSFYAFSTFALNFCKPKNMKFGDYSKISYSQLGSSLQAFSRKKKSSGELVGDSLFKKVKKTGILGAMMLTIDIVIVARVFLVASESTFRPIESSVLALAFMCAILQCVVLASVLNLIVKKKSKRTSMRLDVAKSARVNNDIVSLINLTPRGAGISTTQTYNAGDTISISFSLSELGSKKSVAANAIVRSCLQVDEINRVGIEFVELSYEDKKNLTAFCSIIYPYLQLRKIHAPELKDESAKTASIAINRHVQSNSNKHSFVKIATIIALVAMSIISAPPYSKSDAAPLPGGTISGKVFVDFNADGQTDTGPTISSSSSPAYKPSGDPSLDIGLANVAINARCVSDNGADLTIGTSDDVYSNVSTTTSSTGTYSLTTTGSPCRVSVDETSLPSQYRSGPHGTNNNSLVQFVPAPSASVDFGVNNPDNYCENNPYLCTSKSRYAWMSNATSAPTITNVSAYQYGLTKNNPDASPYTTTERTGRIRDNQIGSIFGQQYNRTADKMYYSTFNDAGTRYGPSGIGAIYTSANPKSSATLTPSLLLDVSTVGINVGSSTKPSAASTCSQYTGDPLAAASGGTNADCYRKYPASFSAATKESFGDMQIASNDSNLFVINLKNQSIINVGLNADGSANTAATTEYTPPASIKDDCSTGNVNDWRMFGLGRQHNLIYVGVTCTGQSTQSSADLSGRVYSFDEANLSGGLTFVKSIVLDYPRENDDVLTTTSTRFRPWTDTQNVVASNFDGSNCPSAGACTQVYAQPILSDIDFASTGDMVVSVRDRLADQVTIYWTGTTPRQRSVAIGFDFFACGGVCFRTEAWIFAMDGSNGDTFMLCDADGSAITTGWNEENNGTCSSTHTSSPYSAFGPYPARSSGMGGLGSGGQTRDFFGSKVSAGGPQGGQGSSAFIPGSFLMYSASVYASWNTEPINTGSLVASSQGATLFDARIGHDISGFNFFSNTTGFVNDGEESGVTGLSQDFSKSGALGDLEVMCSSAPVEIGNRVWNDTNPNGIQDPGEASISGVKVRLYNSANTLLGSTTTDAAGRYYFGQRQKDNDASANTIESQNILASNKLVAGQTYSVKIDLADSENQSSIVNQGLGLTSTAQGTDSSIDNDGAQSGNVISYSLTAGGAGNNDHKIDFGFTPKYSLGNLVFEDKNNNGVKDSGETGKANVALKLFTGTGVQVLTGPDGILGNADDSAVPTLSDSNGFYRFQNLDGGDYIVEAALPSGYVTSTGTLGSTSGTYEAAPDPDNDVNNDDNGTLVASTTNVRSAVVTLGGVEPSSEKEAADTIVDSSLDNKSNLTVDFGIFQPAKLGDFVWNDSNANGQQDSGEAGTNGVTVRLYSPGPDNTVGGGDDVLIGSQVTGDNPATPGVEAGWYYFDNLIAGKYFVEFSNLPVGSIFTSQNLGSDTSDSDANTTTGRTSIYDLAYGANDPSIDAGWSQSALSVGSRVWFDANGDGLDNNSETGISGAHVRLFNSGGTQILTGPDGILGNGDDSTSPVVTDSNGHYLFTALAVGNYYIEVTNVGSGLASTLDASQPESSERNDNGISPISGGVRSNVFSLSVGGQPTNDDTSVAGWADTAVDTDSDYTIDFGFYKQIDLAISKTITNIASGPFTLGDTIQYSVTVTNNGPGDAIAGYTIEDTLPSGLDTSSAVVTSATGLSTCGFTGAALSCVASSSLANGASITITYEAKVIAAPNANSAARTNRAQVVPASGEVTETIPLNDPASNNKDNKVFPLASGASIGDFVFYDANHDGVQQGGEPGVSGVNAKLYRFDDANANNIVDSGEATLVATDTTDSNGNYGATKGTASFQNLSPNKFYFVEFSNLPSGYIPTTKNAATASGPANPLNGTKDNDSDADTASGLRTIPVLLSAGETDLTLDLGVNQAYASLGDHVWLDKNRNGLFNASEAPVAGVLVELYRWTDFDSDGNRDAGEVSTTPIATTSTNASGDYLFANLDPGYFPTRYWVKFILPAAYEFSPQSVSGSTAPTSPNASPTNDSDADVSTGETASTVLNPGENDLTFDAGIHLIPASIGNKVWYDTNENGVQDSGEGPVENVTVELRDSSGVLVATTSTNSSGNYSFTGVEPGQYSVRFVLSTLPNGYAPTILNATATDGDSDSDANRTSGETIVTTLDPGENDPSWDLGIVPRAALGDFIFYDKNRNGVQDADENGVAGVGLDLFDAANVLVKTTLTDSAGKYNFTDLPIGDYKVVVKKSTLPVNYIFTSTNSGSDDAKDSDASITGEMSLTNLVAGENDLSFDAGIYQPSASLGDYVWFDKDTDGVQDSDELGVGGVEVKLYDANSGLLVRSTVTDSNGKYLFDVLEPGDYVVEFVLPPNYVMSESLLGGNDAKDSDANVGTKRTRVISLAPGDVNLTIDAGIYDPVLVRGLNEEKSNVLTGKLPFTGNNAGELLVMATSILLAGSLILGSLRSRNVRFFRDR